MDNSKQSSPAVKYGEAALALFVLTSAFFAIDGQYLNKRYTHKAQYLLDGKVEIRGKHKRSDTLFMDLAATSNIHAPATLSSKCMSHKRKFMLALENQVNEKGDPVVSDTVWIRFKGNESGAPELSRGFYDVQFQSPLSFTDRLSRKLTPNYEQKVKTMWSKFEPCATATEELEYPQELQSMLATLLAGNTVAPNALSEQGVEILLNTEKHHHSSLILRATSPQARAALEQLFESTTAAYSAKGFSRSKAETKPLVEHMASAEQVFSEEVTRRLSYGFEGSNHKAFKLAKKFNNNEMSLQYMTY